MTVETWEFSCTYCCKRLKILSVSNSNQKIWFKFNKSTLKDEERLAEEVQKIPCRYDKGDEGLKKIEKERMAWGRESLRPRRRYINYTTLDIFCWKGVLKIFIMAPARKSLLYKLFEPRKMKSSAIVFPQHEKTRSI